MNYAKNARTNYQDAQEKEQTTLDYYLSKIEENDSETIKRIEKEDFELVEKYILGASKEGRNPSEVFDFGTHVFKNDENTIQNANVEVIYLISPDEQWVCFMYKNGIYKFQSYYSEETETSITKNFELLYTLEYTKDAKVEFLGWAMHPNNKADEYKQNYYIKYNNKVYRMIINHEPLKIESVEVAYEPKGREGQVVVGGTYDKWIILTDRNGLVEIVSPDAMGSLTLGSGDIAATENLSGDNAGTVDENDTAILSYNNAITTINNYCKSIVTTETDKSKIRSVGGTNNEGTSYHTMSTNFNNWFKGDKESVPSGDMQYELDYVKLAYFGKIVTNKKYWLASRYVDDDSSLERFFVRGISTDDNVRHSYLWKLDESGTVSSISPSHAVRPVVINPSGI